jgi:NAD(P)H-dependent FMN reductase/GNAT superfamily N-acetyltransferase
MSIGQNPLTVELHAGSRARLRPLFELAEDSGAQLESYVDAGRVLVAVEAEQIVGHLQLTETDVATELEIRNMAVLESHRRRGVGRKLIAAAIELACEESRHVLRVATAAADVDNLRFYQQLGFRMRSIERDAFTTETGYNPDARIDGIGLRDRVWLDRPVKDETGAPVRLLLISGSTRRGSTNSAALRSAAQLLGDRADVVVYEELDGLPHFNPDDDRDPLPAPVVELREAIANADAVIFCTPEYAGTLPGSFKNPLDWTVGGAEMDGRPAAWLNVAAPGRGLGADATLRSVLGYVNARVLASSGRRTPVGREAVGTSGIVQDADVRADLADALAAFVAELRSGADLS